MLLIEYSYAVKRAYRRMSHNFCLADLTFVQKTGNRELYTLMVLDACMWIGCWHHWAVGGRPEDAALASTDLVRPNRALVARRDHC